LFTYSRASCVNGGNAGGGALDARSRNRKPATPASSTTPITMANVGTPAFGAVGPTALSTANCHLSQFDCRRGAPPPELQVAADRLDAHQHLREIPRDCHLAHRERQLAVANPQAGRAARIIAGHDVHAEAHQFGDVESVAHALENLLRRLDTAFEVQVPVSDA